MTALRNALQLIIFLVFAAQAIPAQALMNSTQANEELSAATKSVNEGHVRDAYARLSSLLQQIDPINDKDTYWRVGASLVEYLTQTEDHARAAQVLSSIIATKIPAAVPAYKQWMQFYIGRNLAYSGKPDEGEKFLRALTGGDARLVHIPAQRAAAVMLSKIELDRGNVSQAAIWMRRSVIGLLVDTSAASGEILEILTEYANYLQQTRQLAEANVLFLKLAPLYNSLYAHRNPKYLHFRSLLLSALSAVGNFPAVVLNQLNEEVSQVDVVAPSVRSELAYQNLYRASRDASQEGRAAYLKQVSSNDPDLLKQPRNLIIFSYFALLTGDIGLSEEFISDLPSDTPLDQQLAAYELILKSYIAARRSSFDISIALAQEALEKIRLFHDRFEEEGSERLPAITAEERLVLSLILGITSPHVVTFDQANALFELEQFLNRDKVKLGLNERVLRQQLKSDLEKEDVRTRDRLKDLRDRMMHDAVQSLLGRILPLRNNYTVVQNIDYGPLIRLEDVEDRIANAHDQLGKTNLPEMEREADKPIQLAAVMRLIRPGEVLILHTVVGDVGLVTTCIDTNNWTFDLQTFDKSQRQQIVVDEKLLSAAVHRSDEPSVLDASFPAESAHGMYDLFFGGVEQCLRGKTAILLATDADFFALPWNALLTKAQLSDQEFRFKDAPWLPKSYSLSLLPSVKSLYELRAILPPSRARQKFLGIGDPDFKGTERRTEIALGPLYSSRGVANKTEISNLPRLPKSASELRVVADALGAPTDTVLLGANATERQLRQRPLNDYRVLSFATHALVAGEIEGITEPALVLTPGDGTSSKNDGLLTASEIANLTLDANLVILSACNTAASDGHASGRGLSGLADAFFFAGARSLAVTQWPVFSSAAQKLGAGLVSRSVRSSEVGVAEGLRLAMLDYVATAKEDYLANPRFWAAFVIAGDGAVRPLDSVDVTPGADGGIDLEWERLTPSASNS